MKLYEDMQYHSVAETLVGILQEKTLNGNPLFFRILVAYYFCKLASMMRCSISTHDRGTIPINMYAINLATSGQGKGHSTNIIEEQVIAGFRKTFQELTFPAVADQNMALVATERAAKKNTDPDVELERLRKEFENAGELPFSFDSGTVPAVKQARYRLLLANIGSLNMEIDEIGSNLLGNTDVLNTYLELFDVGKTKNKLTKNTAENTRGIDMDGRTPTNMMLFGTPSKLLDGSKTEEEFISMLDTGYARRCIFGLQSKTDNQRTMTPEQIYDLLTSHNTEVMLQTIHDSLESLALLPHYNKTLTVSKDVTLLYIAYKMHCEEQANALPDHQELRKIELCHRYFKAIKLAGAYAFIDSSPEITEDHLYNAIKLAEDSGESFKRILTREKNYVRLAKYLGSVEKEVTHTDIMDELPCYKGGESYRKEMLNLAIAYGYRNNIIIKKILMDNIEFFQGESIKEVNLDKMKISYSTQLAEGYLNEEVPFDKLGNLTSQVGYHFCTHHLKGGYRNEENCIPGCDMVVFDVDGGTSIDMVKLLFAKYSYHIYTTKRHTAQANRFRIIMPLSHQVKLDAEDFKEFMKNLYDWLPFKVDDGTNQRSRKWLTHPGTVITNNGEPINSLDFIPKTVKCEEQKIVINSLSDMDNLERWFAGQTSVGNRSNNLIRYAYMLVDSGMPLTGVQSRVMQLNNKLPKPLDENEVLSTIMVTATKHFHQKNVP